MNSSEDRAGRKQASALANEKDATRQGMTQNDLTGGQPAATDNWWDGQLRALYQSVLEEPLPEDMIRLIRAPKQKRGDVKAKGSRKPEDE